MSVQPTIAMTAPATARQPLFHDLQDLAKGILYFGLLGFGLLIPIILPLYAVLSH